MKTLHCCRRDDVISCRPENHHKSKQHYLINFKEFNESSVKTKVRHVQCYLLDLIPWACVCEFHCLWLVGGWGREVIEGIERVEIADDKI